ncbi:MAG: divalent-cation tolerance protein CutA [Pseudomonadota bacterium]
MSEKNTYKLVLCSCPNQEIATTIAENIVAQHLAACINIVPGIKSVYYWQGNVESAEESLMLIKTHQEKLSSLQNTITTMHPYEVPEIISLDISDGLPKYLDWITSSMRLKGE